MFLLYINDIITDIDSLFRIFADDCLLYKIINAPEDTTILQKDLDQITTWISTWQLRLNISKCVVIHCGRFHSPNAHQYTLNNCILQQTNSHLYLGVMLDRSLSWSRHIAKKQTHWTSLRETWVTVHQMLKPQLIWQWCIPRSNMLLLFGIHIITTIKINWNQSSEGLVDGFSVTIEELVQYHQCSWPSLQIRRKRFWDYNCFTRFSIIKHLCQFQYTTCL